MPFYINLAIKTQKNLVTNNKNNGKLIVFSAPSGSGKTTIVRHLLGIEKLNLEFGPQFGYSLNREVEFEDNPLGAGFINYRVRVSNDSNDLTATLQSNGEVEDYQVNNTVPLPVELLYFEARKQGIEVLLSWKQLVN